jgi:hypothetical protein
MSPLANAFLTDRELYRMEPFYPLRALVCLQCFLVQLEVFETPDHIFSDYAYFSSYSKSWLDHARRYVDTVVERFGVNADSQVVEVASNDGYLLQYFREREIPALGIEPAANVAKVAQDRGIRTLVEFFGTELARRLAADRKADLLIANNVLAHTPHLNDFVAGIKLCLAEDGIATLEFPHLMRLMADHQFDTIYHEHFSYFSFLTVDRIFSSHGLHIVDVDELTTHGGSLRIYVRHAEAEADATPATEQLRQRERVAGFEELDHYMAFDRRIQETKRELLSFFIGEKQARRAIVGYGAAAKGNTLLNYCGIGRDFLDYTVDRNPEKQGRFLPGTHIPVEPPERIEQTRPDLVFVVPWNLNDEIVDQLAFIRDWGGRFVVRTPDVKVL